MKRVALPPILDEVALVTAAQAAATCGQAISGWRAAVARGDAPLPVVRRPRFTRWRAADVAAHAQAIADAGIDAARDAEIRDRAARASAARRRKAAASAGGQR